VVRADRQRPELVEGETPLWEAGQDLVDAVEFGVEVGIVGGLPGSGALKADAVSVRDLPESFPADPEPTGSGCGAGGRRACTGSTG